MVYSQGLHIRIISIAEHVFGPPEGSIYGLHSFGDILMSSTFVFPDKVHPAFGHRRIENILGVLGSFGNCGSTTEIDMHETIRTAIDEF